MLTEFIQCMEKERLQQAPVSTAGGELSDGPDKGLEQEAGGFQK